MRIVEFKQLQLWRRKGRVVQRGMTDRAQALLAFIVRTAIPCEEGLLIFDVQLPFVDPHGDPVPR